MTRAPTIEVWFEVRRGAKRLTYKRRAWICDCWLSYKIHNGDYAAFAVASYFSYRPT